jgi:hypothetical protein
MEDVGIRVYRMSSSPTTIATKRVWRWRRPRCYMVVGVKPCCFRIRWENGKFFDSTFCKMSWDKFVWWERTCGLRSQDRRVTPIIGEENWVLKFETTHTSRCYLWEGYDVSRYETSSHLGTLVCSRSRRREISIEGRISKFLFWAVRISGTRFILRGVGLSHPKIPNFRMWLKFSNF